MNAAIKGYYQSRPTQIQQAAETFLHSRSCYRFKFLFQVVWGKFVTFQKYIELLARWRQRLAF